MPITSSATAALTAFRLSPTARLNLGTLLVVLLICAACSQPTSTAAQTETTPAANDPSLLLAQAQQGDAPALAISGNRLVAVWLGVDERGIHQDARRLIDGRAETTVTLPLPPRRPYAQALIPGLPGQTHLLWLDTDETAQNRLYSALLAADLSVIRGPVAVSEGLALEFSTVTDNAGGLWSAWSGGMIAEPTVYVRRSDEEGRPLLQTTTISMGQHPALLRAPDGAIWLFWLNNGELNRQRLGLPNEASQSLTGTISLVPGDQLVNVRAALDTTSAYFFWNVTRANGVSETWWTAGARNASAWRQPQRLTDETGNLLHWVAPAADAPDFATAAAASDAGLGIVTFSEGRVTGYKLVVPEVRLLGMPALVTAPADNFALAWATPALPNAELRLLWVPR